MALDQSVLSELLDAFRTGEGIDLVREAVTLVAQELIESELTAHIGPERYERTESRTTERNGHWTGLDDVEFATMGYIDWFNHRRLHGEITDDNTYVTPAEFEATYYRQEAPALEAVTQ